MAKKQTLTRELKTNDIFIETFNTFEISQGKFAKIVSVSQPNIHAYLNKQFELRFSEFQRYMKVFNMEYDIVCISDSEQIELKSELRKLEIKLIKAFSKEKDYDLKKKLDLKIDAIKTLLTE